MGTLTTISRCDDEGGDDVDNVVDNDDDVGIGDDDGDDVDKRNGGGRITQ